MSGEAPFVERSGNKLGGISLTIWREIAGVNNFDYQLVPQPNAQANLDALAAGELDVAIGPITITPQRIAQPGFEFTQPYFYAEEAVLVPRERANVLERLKALFGVAALSSVACCVVSLCCWQPDLAGGATQQSFAIPAPLPPRPRQCHVVCPGDAHHRGLRRPGPGVQNRPCHHRGLDGDFVDRCLLDHRWFGFGVHLGPGAQQQAPSPTQRSCAAL